MSVSCAKVATSPNPALLSLTLALCISLMACSTAKKKSPWDNVRYQDNDASYVAPAVNVGCMDDAPNC